jgi:hypothetical protein
MRVDEYEGDGYLAWALVILEFRRLSRVDCRDASSIRGVYSVKGEVSDRPLH